MLRTWVPPPLLALRARLMVRALNGWSTTQPRPARGPRSPTRREWTAAIRPPPPRPCTPLPRQGRRV
eukprot:5126241-Pleurochrysis_carterae.AAC.1